MTFLRPCDQKQSLLELWDFFTLVQKNEENDSFFQHKSSMQWVSLWELIHSFDWILSLCLSFQENIELKLPTHYLRIELITSIQLFYNLFLHYLFYGWIESPICVFGSIREKVIFLLSHGWEHEPYLKQCSFCKIDFPLKKTNQKGVISCPVESRSNQFFIFL